MSLCLSDAYGSRGFLEVIGFQAADLSADGRYALVRGSASGSTGVTRVDLHSGDVVSIDNPGFAQWAVPHQGTLSDSGHQIVVVPQNNQYVYYFDLQGETSQLVVGRDSAGAGASDLFSLPTVSPDGRFVLFYTNSTTLIADLPAIPSGQTANWANLILWDRQTGQYSLGAAAPDGSPLNAPVLMETGLPRKRFSADGRYIVYATYASNAHPDIPSGATHQTPMLFRRDLQTGSVDLVSSTASGEPALANYSYPAISSDGSKIVFMASFVGIFGPTLIDGYNPGFNLAPDIYIKDMATGAVTRVTQTTDGNPPAGFIQGTSGNASAPLAITGDARHVAFQASSANLVPGDNRDTWSILLADLSGESVQISRLSAPEQAPTLHEAANVVVARDRFLWMFRTTHREQFGLGQGEGLVIYGDLHVGGVEPLVFLGSGSYPSPHGNWYFSTVFGWLTFNPETGWAYSPALQSHLYFPAAQGNLDDAGGFWFYRAIAAQSGYWAYSHQDLIYLDSTGYRLSGWFYVPDDHANAPSWLMLP